MSVDPAELLATQETVNLEFKRHGKDRDKISKAICAFPTTSHRRGTVTFSLALTTKECPPVGVDTSDEELLNLANLRDQGQILGRPSMTAEDAPDLHRGQNQLAAVPDQSGDDSSMSSTPDCTSSAAAPGTRYLTVTVAPLLRKLAEGRQVRARA